jgi:hypothetical protein
MNTWDTPPTHPNIYRVTWNRRCRFCNVSLLSTEVSTARSAFCCGGEQRQHRYTALPPYPSSLADILSDPHISSKSRALNLVFSFASMETDAVFPNIVNGFVAIQGKLYHRIRPTHQSSAIRWILYDGFEDRNVPHPSHYSNLSSVWIDVVRHALMTRNPLVRNLTEMSQLALSGDNEIGIELLDSASPDIVALIHYDGTTTSTIQPRRLTVRFRDETIQYVPSTSPWWEPLAYPLFFPDGTLGWGVSENGK